MPLSISVNLSPVQLGRSTLAASVQLLFASHQIPPGAIEFELTESALMDDSDDNLQRFHALIALGIIIRGETYHFELVSNESGAGVTRVGLDFNIPIANAILTTENDDQAIARMNIKGEDAAVVAVEMANLLTTIHNTDAAE